MEKIARCAVHNTRMPCFECASERAFAQEMKTKMEAQWDKPGVINAVRKVRLGQIKTWLKYDNR